MLPPEQGGPWIAAPTLGSRTAPTASRPRVAIHTDAPEFLATLLPAAAAPTAATEPAPGRGGTPDPALLPLLAAFHGEAGGRRPPVPLRCGMWRHLLVSGHADGSQYDRLIRLARDEVPLPHGVACVARTATGLQGFRGRSWVASPGNLHLTVHLAPGRAIERFETVFTALAAVAVLEAVDALPGLGGRARIRWVNDVVIDGAKVGGVLAHTQTRGEVVTTVTLGIGVNVETSPAVPLTVFVPAAAALRDFAPNGREPRLRQVLWPLLQALERNYRRLLDGGFAPIMDAYRRRSAVLGAEVFVSSDDADEQPRRLAAGRVRAIGDGLELLIDGRPRPVTRGRLVLDAATVARLCRAQPHDPAAPHPAPRT